MHRRLKWTEEEDSHLREVMNGRREGRVNWEDVSESLGAFGISKTSKQARERWIHHLNARKGPRSLRQVEAARLLELHASLGCRWKKISESFPGTTDGHVKNLFFSLVRKGFRKARRLGSKFDKPSSVASVKPRVLARFVVKELRVPEELWPTGTALPWLTENPISIRHFVLFFASSRPGELWKIRDERLRAIVDFVLDELDSMNTLYKSSKEKTDFEDLDDPEDPENQDGLPPSQTGFRPLAKEFRFLLGSLRANAARSPPGPYREDLAFGLRALAKTALELADALLSPAESPVDFPNLANLFGPEPSSEKNLSLGPSVERPSNSEIFDVSFPKLSFAEEAKGFFREEDSSPQNHTAPMNPSD